MSKKSHIKVQVGDVLISLTSNFLGDRLWYGIRITKSGPDHTGWVPLGVFETRGEAFLKAQSLGLNPIAVDFEVAYGILEESGKVVEFLHLPGAPTAESGIMKFESDMFFLRNYGTPVPT